MRVKYKNWHVWLLLVVAVVVAVWVGLETRSVKTVEVTKEVTRVVEETVVVKETVVVTATATPAPTSTPTLQPTSTPTMTTMVSPSATATVNSLTSSVAVSSSVMSMVKEVTSTTVASVSFTRDLCTHCGEVAWHAENQISGELYGDAPIGGLNEECAMVLQMWTSVGPERFLVYLPAHIVMWLRGHSGGTGWYVDQTVDVVADLKKQANELLQRDGEMKTTFIYLPQDASKFRLLIRIQVATVPTITVMPTMTPTLASKPAVAATATVTATIAVASGKCNIGSESVGPAILEGEVDGKPIVIKLNAGSVYTLKAGGCFPFNSQSDLDARWSKHKAEFLAKYPNGQAVER